MFHSITTLFFETSSFNRVRQSIFLKRKIR